MKYPLSQVDVWREELAALPEPDRGSRKVGKAAAIALMAKELQAAARRGFSTAQLVEVLAAKGLKVHADTLRAALRKAAARPSGSAGRNRRLSGDGAAEVSRNRPAAPREAGREGADRRNGDATGARPRVERGNADGADDRLARQDQTEMRSEPEHLAVARPEAVATGTGGAATRETGAREADRGRASENARRPPATTPEARGRFTPRNDSEDI